jgi:hypothetical protein
MYAALGLTPTDQEKIKQAIYYLDADNAMLWETLKPTVVPQGSAPNVTLWTLFQSNIGKLYPGSDSNRLYSSADLERLSYDSALKGVYTRAELGDYFRNFTRISSYLTAQQRIDAATIDRLYIQGFGEATRRRIEQRLAITQPNLHPDDPYPMNLTQEAATFLLASTNPLAPAVPATVTITVPGTSTVPVTVKPEPMDMNTLGTLLLNMQSQISQLAANQNSTKNSSSPYNDNANTTRRFTGCVFCSDISHRISACPRVDEYQRLGKCKKNDQGKICLPSGKYVPMGTQGSSLAESIDRWHASNPGNLASGIPTISTSIYESVAEDIALIEAIGNTDDDDDDSEMAVFARVFANQLAKSADKKKKASTAKATPFIEIPTKPAYKPAPSQPAPIQKPAQTPAPIRAASKDPQYHFLSPAENPTLVQTVLDRALDVQIPVSTRELLAVSQDVRRRIKDHTTTKKVAVTSAEQIVPAETTEAYITGDTADVRDLVVAKDAAPLRSIDGILDGRIKAEILLDSGSSIVAVRKNIWEQLGTPIRSDLVMNMESSHSTIETTVGVLKNFPVTIGPCTFYLQVQVSENLPCDVMMGRPFFMLTRAVTMDHPDGTQDLVLHDPNTGDEITLPTQQRDRKKKKAGVQDTGF